jgi:Fe2+ transport system protein FeoA
LKFIRDLVFGPWYFARRIGWQECNSPTPARIEFPFLKPSLNSHTVQNHVNKKTSAQTDAEGAPNPLRQLSGVQPGVFFRIKQLSASPEMTKRLRELGFCEEQRIKLLSRNPNLICQVCNARLGLSSHLADLIWVEKIKPQRLAA